MLIIVAGSASTGCAWPNSYDLTFKRDTIGHGRTLRLTFAVSDATYVPPLVCAFNIHHFKAVDDCQNQWRLTDVCLCGGKGVDFLSIEATTDAEPACRLDVQFAVMLSDHRPQLIRDARTSEFEVRVSSAKLDESGKWIVEEKDVQIHRIK